MQKRALVTASLAAIFMTFSYVAAPIQAYASEDTYTGVVTQEEMDKEVAMYDEETGEFFFVKDQETADYCTENYGWSQVTKECVNSGMPDYIKKAGEGSTSDAQTATSNKEANTDMGSDQTEALSDDESIAGQEANEADDKTNDRSASEEKTQAENKGAQTVMDDDINTHGPFAEMNEKAKDALLTLLADESIGTDARYIEIYGTASNIIIDAEMWSEICDAGNAFSIKVVGPKDNLLYQYNFLTESLNKTEEGIELKLTAVAEDDVHTYMSFNKTQDLPGSVEFVYPSASTRTNYEMRSEDGEVVASGASDDDGTLKLTIEKTDNYELVDIDHEELTAEGTESKNSCINKNDILTCAGIAVVAGSVIGILIYRKKRR